MKIENNDIDYLIDVTVFLSDLAKHPEDYRYKKNFAAMAAHVRKVYILLLQASSRNEPGVKHLIEKGIKNDSPAAETIRRLCPETESGKLLPYLN